ncbi:MAG: DUF2970 domain-containing protein [Gammaproteobacteria bacterium]|nr:DUF2970 domain-containing protein [Gammaproteobacteria bacterium]
MPADQNKQPSHSLLKVIRSIFAAALGVQKNEQRLEDFKQGRARDFIIGGILFVVLFVATLVGLVNWILSA